MLKFAQLPEISGGLPYVNSDFSDILQNQLIDSYKQMLEVLNDPPLDRNLVGIQPITPAVDNNSGIVLSGCDILLADGTQYQMGFTNSIVYIGGEFYEKDVTVPTYSVISSSTFYIFPGPTVSECRILRDLTTANATASHTRYFTYSTIQPNGPHIKFSCQGTSRYYKRLVKYFTSVPGDVCMTTSLNNFSATGLGFNDMEGFVLLNDCSSSVYGSVDGRFYPNLGGRFVAYGDGTDGIARPTQLSECDFNQNPSRYACNSICIRQNELPQHSDDPTHITGQALNFYPNIFLEGICSGDFSNVYNSDWNAERCNPNTSFMEHSHYFNFFPAGRVVSIGNTNERLELCPVSSRTSYVFSEADNQDNWPPSVDMGSLFMPGRVNRPTGSVKGFAPFIYDICQNDLQEFSIHQTGGISDYPNSNLAKHTHGVNPALGASNVVGENGTAHENRPPYFVVAYYTKKPF